MAAATEQRNVEPVTTQDPRIMVFYDLKRTHEMFLSDEGDLPPPDEKSRKLRLKAKAAAEYGPIVAVAEKAKRDEHRYSHQLALPAAQPRVAFDSPAPTGGEMLMLEGAGGRRGAVPDETQQGPRPVGSQLNNPSSSAGVAPVPAGREVATNHNTRSLLPRRHNIPKPKWHPPWKLYRVISGHTGWVRALDVEPANQWFVSGAGDRVVKIWDLATGTLKLSLTGHVSTVRAVKVSPRHPYMFTAGEDKQVKCWDLECNKVIRHYHGHLSAVHDLCIHPTIDVLLTCGRDSVVRVWDMRTKANIHVLTGHTNTVAAVVSQSVEPQVISGSHDTTVRLWDLAAGKSMCTLTNHKKSVRALALHPTLYMFASASPDNIKHWRLPRGEFLRNLNGHHSIINALACNKEDVLVSGGDNGSLQFWDWRSGYCFQREQTKVQPGSIESEAGIYALCFDQSGSRLLTAEADKTIKCYKEDDTATEETHPIEFKPGLKQKSY